MFKRLPKDMEIYASFYQLVGNDATDLLNEKKPIKIAEDQTGKVTFFELTEVKISNP